MSYFQHLRAVSARHDQCHIFIKTFPMVLNAMAKNIELITPQLQKMSSSGSGAPLWLWNRQILQLTPFFCHINWCWSVLTDAWLSTSFEADKQFCVMTRNWVGVKVCRLMSCNVTRIGMYRAGGSFCSLVITQASPSAVSPPLSTIHHLINCLHSHL